MPNHFLYFAYGSNMSSARLIARTPSAKAVATACLPEYTMGYTKLGVDASGKCGINPSNNSEDRVYGVLFKIHRAEKDELDAFEGLGLVYTDLEVTVYDQNNEPKQAITYVPLSEDKGLLPWDWYKHHVVSGAYEFDLPQEYIKQLEAVEAMPDSNQARKDRELEIYDF